MATVDEILARQAYAAGDDIWTEDSHYPSYRLYVEPEYVPVTNKRIADFNDQVSVSGEQNAQFVGFQLPRYDDGIDLRTQNLYIHYQTAFGGSDSVPCNVSWSDNYVRICWMVPAQATQEPDRVQMMIYATATNSAGERTVWKTLPASYTIHDGLEIGGGIPEPDTSWYEQFVAQMEAQVSTAQGHANDAQASKTAATGSATAAAESAAASAQALEDNKAYVESQKETFVGYNKRETDLKYANALVGSASGMGRVSIGDAWEAPVAGMDISGRSEQVVTTGAQLLDLTAKIGPREKNGVTVNINSDGSISVNGTASGDTAFILDSNSHMTLEPGKNYALRGYGTDFDNSFFWQCWTKEPSNVFKDIGSGVTFLYIQKSEFNFAIIVKSGKTVNATFRPMINEGTVPLPWEPYTGGKPSPSPDYPQPVKGTGTVSTGAQMLDISSLQSSNKKLSVEISKDEIKLIRFENVTQYISVPYNLNIENEGSYTLQYDSLMGDFLAGNIVEIVDSNEQRIMAASTTNKRETANMAAGIYKIRIFAGNNVSGTGVIKGLRLTANSNVPWEPYTGGKPSPSPEYPQPLDVTVTGKQLLNLDGVEKQKTVAGITYTIDGQNGAITANGTATDIAILSLPISIPEGEKVYIGAGNSSTTPSGNIQVLLRLSGDNGVEASSNTYLSNQNATNIFITTKYCNLFQFRIGPGETVNNFVIKPMIAPSDKPLSWQPYQSRTATITLTEPLHGIGDYRDRIMCRDGVWGVERCLIKKVYTGQEGFGFLNETNQNYLFYGSENLQSLLGNYAESYYCNYFTAGNARIDTDTVGSYVFNDTIRFRVGKDIATNANDFKEWLLSRYEAGNPIVIIYPVTTPTWEPLPSATQSALNALTTYTGTTHVTITAGGPEPDVGMGYVMDTRAVIADLQAQIDEIRGGTT